MFAMWQRHVGLPLQADPQLAAKLVQFRFARPMQSIGDAAKAIVGWEEVTVLHQPKLAFLVAELASQFDRAVNLMVGGLADLIADRCKVVAIDRPGSARDRARRALRRVVLVDAHTAFGRDRWPGHFQQVEL